MDYGRTFKLDTSGDIVINELKCIEMVDGIDKVAQDIHIILKTVKESFPFDANFGMDYFQIIESDYSKQLIESEVVKALANYPFIKSIDEIEISKPDTDRKAIINIRLTVTSGDLLNAETSL
jgi:phage baseplate assembly protein W